MLALMPVRSLLPRPRYRSAWSRRWRSASGALTVTFGIVNAALFREPPFHDAKRLAMLYLVRNPIGERSGASAGRFRAFKAARITGACFEHIANYSTHR